MASAGNIEKIVIFRGDDTGGAFGRTISITIEAAPGVSLDGCRAEWVFDGIVKDIPAPLVSGETREVFYSHNETRCMQIGVRYGTFRIIDAAGKVRTLTNTKAVEVTDNVARCYPGASAASFTVRGIGDMNHSEFADLEEREGMTLKEVGAMVNTLVRKLKGTVAAFSALLAVGAAFGAMGPDTEFGDVSPSATLRDVVEAGGGGGSGGVDTNAVERIANEAVETNRVTVSLVAATNSLTANVAAKADMATTLGGYGITDGATKAEVENKRDVDDFVVYAPSYAWRLSDITHDPGEFSLDGSVPQYMSDNEWNCRYVFNGETYYAVAYGQPESTSLSFSHAFGVSFIATRYADGYVETDDRIATTNGVLAVIRVEIEKNDKIGTDSQIVRGRYEDGDGTWEIAVDSSRSSRYASFAESVTWGNVTEKPMVVIVGEEMGIVNLATYQGLDTVVFGSASRFTRIGGSSIDLFGGSTYVNGDLKPVKSVQMTPEQFRFTNRGNINLIELIESYIHSNEGSGLSVTDPSYSFANQARTATLSAPHIPTEDNPVMIPQGTLTYDGSNYWLNGETQYDRNTEGDIKASVTLDQPMLTNVVTAVKSHHYDETLEVTWRQVMDDGHIYFIAVTNANVVAQ